MDVLCEPESGRNEKSAPETQNNTCFDQLSKRDDKSRNKI